LPDGRDDYEKKRFLMDTHLPEKLKTPRYRNAIVELLIEHAQRYCSNGGLPPMPEEFLEATKETVQMNDAFKLKFEEHCVVEEGAKASKYAIAQKFDMNERDVLAELKGKRGFDYGKDRSYKGKKGVFTGLRLKTEDELTAEAAAAKAEEDADIAAEKAAVSAAVATEV
jgi:hypothetical protein